MVPLLVMFLATQPVTVVMPANCGEHGPMTKQLETVYKERQSAIGLAANGNGLVELFVSSTGGWTLIITTPAGMTCVIATGEAWEQFAPQPETQAH